MILQGSFESIISIAREYNRRYFDPRDFQACDTVIPMNPVVRREGGKWSIESELIPSPDCDFECTLDGFCEYWFADGDDITPDEGDIRYWVAQFDFE